MTLAAKIGSILLLAGALWAQGGASRSALGTITALKPELAAFDMQLDQGGLETVTLSEATVLQRVAPGAKDLKGAAPMKAAELAVGDRVLVSWTSGMEEARRVVVMGASEIAKKREAERQDWLRRGVAGVVDTVRDGEIILKARSFGGEKTYTVKVKPETVFRRYKPDSVKFSDAVLSKLSEVKKGDQLRARGVKSEDGTQVEAGEAVFGSFLTRAGTVVAVDAGKGELRLKDLDTGKALVVRASSDTQIKKMPPLPAGGAPGGGGMRAVAAGAMAAGGPRNGGGDLAQMLERMPASKLSDIQPGEVVVVSSTKGMAKDEVTAIMLLGNASRLVEMAAAMAQRQSMASGLAGGGLPGGMSGGAMGGLELPGMLP